MKYPITTIAATGAAALGLACATSQGPQTTPAAASAVYASTIIPAKGSDNTSSSSASASNASSSGMWVDSVGGTWMDGQGAFYMGGQRGMPMGLQSTNVASWTNANIFAHLAAGDSLEIKLSQQGASQAQNQAVRDFANRMVSEHTTHLQTGTQLASQGGITPALAAGDTADAFMGTRIIDRLSAGNGNFAGGGNYDRRFMRAEVMMHQHMLQGLQMLRPQASGQAAQLIDQTIPVVQQHLSAAQAVWRQVGGGMDSNGASTSTGKQ